MKEIFFPTLAALLVAGCNFQLPSNRYIYKLACEALEEAQGVPKGAVPAPMERARVSVGKNAAWVELPYTYDDSAGGREDGTHVVWFKRIARTWTVDRTLPRSEMMHTKDPR